MALYSIKCFINCALYTTGLEDDFVTYKHTSTREKNKVFALSLSLSHSYELHVKTENSTFCQGSPHNPEGSYLRNL